MSRLRARRARPGIVAALAALGLGVAIVPGPAVSADAPAAQFVGLVAGNGLVRFDEVYPGSVSSTIPVSGLAAGEALVAIDMRPATGQIVGFAVSDAGGPDAGRLYSIDPDTGAATAIGTSSIPGLTDGAHHSVDFNPTVDRYRVVNTADQNLRANPNNGSLAATDTNLNPPGLQVASVAYDQNLPAVATGNTTTLFGISAAGQLVRLGGVNGTPSPNGGLVTPLGTLGVVPADANIGFDVSAQGTAFASLRVGSTVGLYTVNLQTGAATSLGPIGNGSVPVIDISMLSTTVPDGAAQLVAVPPARLLDTRTGAKPDAGATVDVQVTGQGGVPASGVTAAVLNVTVTDATAPGFLTVWPSGRPRPTASVLNVTRAGQTVAALVTVPVGADGKVSVFIQSGAHVVVDVNGYYRPAATGAGRFTPVVPARLLDTRSGSKPMPGAMIDLPVTGQGGVPASNVAAVALNVTITEATAPGFVTVFPQGGAPPLASSLNADVAGQTIANLVIVPVGPSGQVSLFTLSGTHLTADVVGWFSADPNALAAPRGLFVALGPNRVLDTRSGLGTSGPVPAGGTIEVPVAGQGGVPAAGASAVVATVTATDAGAAGFVTAFPTGAAPPLASNLNPEAPGATVANLVSVGLGGGRLSLFTFAPAHLLADVAGYYLA